ncbi:MAG TPA: hypothetical protein VJU86_06280 [Pyrinomonadaceae bacterium]|nr:hypothetical protein [Pyrinomonadaceae bacterium]
MTTAFFFVGYAGGAAIGGLFGYWMAGAQKQNLIFRRRHRNKALQLTARRLLLK